MRAGELGRDLMQLTAATQRPIRLRMFSRRGIVHALTDVGVADVTRIPFPFITLR
jgi:hypothetical protein